MKLFKKKQAEMVTTETVVSKKPATYKEFKPEDIKEDYNIGLNHQQLAEKYDLSIEEVAAVIGA